MRQHQGKIAFLLSTIASFFASCGADTKNNQKKEASSIQEAIFEKELLGVWTAEKSVPFQMKDDLKVEYRHSYVFKDQGTVGLHLECTIERANSEIEVRGSLSYGKATGNKGTLQLNDFPEVIQSLCILESEPYQLSYTREGDRLIVQTAEAETVFVRSAVPIEELEENSLVLGSNSARSR